MLNGLYRSNNKNKDFFGGYHVFHTNDMEEILSLLTGIIVTLTQEWGHPILRSPQVISIIIQIQSMTSKGCIMSEVPPIDESCNEFYANNEIYTLSYPTVELTLTIDFVLTH